MVAGGLQTGQRRIFIKRSCFQTSWQQNLPMQQKLSTTSKETSTHKPLVSNLCPKFLSD